MNFSQKCINLCMASEGCFLKAYKDSVGVPTIGYGSTRDVHMGMEITQQEADERLIQDLEEAWQHVYHLVNVVLTQGECDALTDFVFNVGVGNFKKSTLLKYVNVGRTDDAAAEFGKWIHAGKEILPGLIKRREAERELFLS